MPQKNTPQSRQESGKVSRNMLLAQTISVENVKGTRGKDSHTILSHALVDSGTLILARRWVFPEGERFRGDPGHCSG